MAKPTGGTTAIENAFYDYRMQGRYFADVDRFPHETIDGETVLIDAEKGYLFLFAGTGPLLWQRFTTGGTIDEVVAESTARYGESAELPTRQFLEQLAEAQLLRPGAESSTMQDEIVAGVWPDTFVAPSIERYDEISDIIAMDPIHEVDPAQGWPHRRDHA